MTERWAMTLRVFAAALPDRLGPRVLLSMGLIVAALLLFVPMAVTAETPVRFRPPPSVEFRPAAGESIAVAFELTRQCAVKLDLYTGDGDRLRTLGADKPLPAGEHEIVWDGKDARGEVVPDEAYHPALTARCGEEGPVTLDPRRNTGGQPLEDLQVRVGGDGTIQYRLSSPARTLIRISAKGGAMLRALDAWTPRAAGRVRMAWNGFDAAGSTRLLGRPDMAVLVRAFALPDHTIIAVGNDELEYADWRAAHGWPEPVVDFEAIRFERNGEPLTRQSQLPRSFLRDPGATIRIVEDFPLRDGMPVVSGPVTFRVDMPRADRWLMAQSLYEVAFFLDHAFISEEETGYTPLSWRWDGNAEPGVHTMSVNISGLWGQVGVDTVRFLVPKRGEQTANLRETP